MPGVSPDIIDLDLLISDRPEVISSQQTSKVEPMLFYRWATVCDAGPTLNQHWVIFSVFWDFVCDQVATFRVCCLRLSVEVKIFSQCGLNIEMSGVY